MALIGTCPSCGAKAPLDHFVIEPKYKQALAAAFRTPPALAELVLPYLGLFAPTSGRAIRADKLARIVDEFATLTTSAEVTRNRITHVAPIELWRAGLEAVIAARDTGSLVLPLDSHAYLVEVVWRKAAKAQAGGERQAPKITHPSHRPFQAPEAKKDTSAEAESLQRLIDASPDGESKTALQRQLRRLKGGSNER